MREQDHGGGDSAHRLLRPAELGFLCEAHIDRSFAPLSPGRRLTNIVFKRVAGADHLIRMFL
jgi:hypothetical protein